MKKSTAMLSYAMIIAGVLTGCGKTEPIKTESIPVHKKEEQIIKETKPVSADVLHAEGTYIGQADENSIEVDTAEKALVLRLDDKTKQTINSFPENGKVSISYTKNSEGQLLLHEITLIGKNGDAPEGKKTLSYSINNQKTAAAAVLTKSNLDYYFYKLDGYTFTSEEPGKDLLSLDKDDGTFVRIEPLPKGTDENQTKKLALEELNGEGTLQDVSGKPDGEFLLGEADFVLKITGKSFTKYIGVKTIKDTKIKFTVSIAGNKDIEENEAAFQAMISTVEPSAGQK